MRGDIVPLSALMVLAMTSAACAPHCDYDRRNIGQINGYKVDYIDEFCTAVGTSHSTEIVAIVDGRDQSILEFQGTDISRDGLFVPNAHIAPGESGSVLIVDGVESVQSESVVAALGEYDVRLNYAAVK